jgi:amylosucrase
MLVFLAYDWEKNKRKDVEHTTENRIFSATQKLIAIRKDLPVTTDQNNLGWFPSENKHVIGFLRTNDKTKLYCVFNFSHEQVFLPWFVLRERSPNLKSIFDRWQNRTIAIADHDQYLCFEPYAFYLLEEKV